MVPDKVDLQHDFVREETIREFAEQFEAFVEAGQAGGGVMHAVWPDGWMALERNEVLDEAEAIGGEEVPAGAWVQEWAINHADLWELIQDGILGGYSIGAIDVGWAGPFEQDDDEIADVDTSEVPDDDLVWELISGIIREVSAVDIPAVPDAQILEAKALEKRLADHLGNRDGFIEEALQRGHSEAEAERLWDVLNEAVEADGSHEPGKQSVLARAGKAFLSAFMGTDEDDPSKTSESSDPGAYIAETSEEDPRGSEKEEATLSAEACESIMASIDANLDVLEDAGVDHGVTRFADRDDIDVSARNNAAGGDTPDPDDTTDMSDDTPDEPMADAPEWAKALNERIDDLETEKDVGDDADPLEDAPEWAKDLAGRVDEIEEKTLDDADEDEEKPEWAKELEARIDRISQQSGVSTQLERAAEPEEDEETGLQGLGKALS